MFCLEKIKARSQVSLALKYIYQLFLIYILIFLDISCYNECKLLKGDIADGDQNTV